MGQMHRENPLGVRVLRLPARRMVTSGMDTGAPFAPGGKLDRFDKWFSQVDASSCFSPHDFLWHDPDASGMEWWYAFEEGMDTGGFDVIEFEGGLYAAAISWDEDDADGERVHVGIQQWVRDSGCFEVDERPRHRTMFHIVTPPSAHEAMGANQLDIFVPIRKKAEQ